VSASKRIKKFARKQTFGQRLQCWARGLSPLYSCRHG
jgi:hypothetical protein